MDEDNIQIHERLARMETMLEALVKAIEDQKKCDASQDMKLDKILENDKDKLQRIAKTEERVKNIKATLWAFAVPICAGIARWFV